MLSRVLWPPSGHIFPALGCDYMCFPALGRSYMFSRVLLRLGGYIFPALGCDYMCFPAFGGVTFFQRLAANRSFPVIGAGMAVTYFPALGAVTVKTPQKDWKPWIPSYCNQPVFQFLHVLLHLSYFCLILLICQTFLLLDFVYFLFQISLPWSFLFQLFRCQQKLVFQRAHFELVFVKSSLVLLHLNVKHNH